MITLPPIHTLNTPAPPPPSSTFTPLSFSHKSATNPKSTSPIFPSKKRKLDFYTIFTELRSGKRAEDIEFIDIEGQPQNSVCIFLTLKNRLPAFLYNLFRKGVKKFPPFSLTTNSRFEQKKNCFWGRKKM